MAAKLKEVDTDLRKLKRGLKQSGVPSRLVQAIETRALRSGRRLTGPFRSNRQSRWRLQEEDPQFGTEIDCKVILGKLLSQLLEFQGGPEVDADTRAIAGKYLGHDPARGTYRDPLTRERLAYQLLEAESRDPRHGISSFHLGHDNPAIQPKHTPPNVSWRSARSNLIQGDLTLTQARSRFVELIARYFELGEVKIEPEEAQ